MQTIAEFGGSSFAWESDPSLDAELILNDDHHCSFKQFLRIVADQNFELSSEKYLKMSRHFVSSSQVAPLLMPRSYLKSSLSRAEEILKESISETENRNYLRDWSKLFKFLQSMKRSKIDRQALEQLMHDRDAEYSRTLRSFLPDESGYAKQVTYNVSESLTGRAKVSSGPLILTAHHDVRKCIKSSFVDGKILSVDFRSVEPRVALLTVGRPALEDVYADLLEEFPGIDRQSAKLATLVALYGGRVNRLAEVLGDLDRARKSVSFVRAHFRVDELERMLNQQAESGLVRNVLGRPLREATKNPRIRTNHFLQSSAAELAALLFADLCSKFHIGIRPLFVIHDALIVDVHPDVLQKFEQEANSITWNQNRMPVKIETLSPI